MKWLKAFAISFSLVFIFSAFGVVSFSAMSQPKARVVNFDKGATIVVPVYEVAMDPIVIAGVVRNNVQCLNEWSDPVDDGCCV